jgi:hypothetical protein
VKGSRTRFYDSRHGHCLVRLAPPARLDQLRAAGPADPCERPGLLFCEVGADCRASTSMVGVWTTTTGSAPSSGTRVTENSHGAELSLTDRPVEAPQVIPGQWLRLEVASPPHHQVRIRHLIDVGSNRRAGAVRSIRLDSPSCGTARGRRSSAPSRPRTTGPGGAISCSDRWSGREDSNLRPPEPHFVPATLRVPI